MKARRQPGSAFKPFVYLAALEAGYTPEHRAPMTGRSTVAGWSPRNYTGNYRGEISLRNSLAHSINTVAVRLTAKVGPSRVAQTAERLGIQSELHDRPSIALGTSEVTLLELTGAYAPFANGGQGVLPHIIARVRDGNGKVLYQRRRSTTGQVVAPNDVGAMNDMLSATIRYGTGQKAALEGHEAAGKTGTTQSFRDAWFVGYTAQYVGGVWIGNDNGRRMKKVTGGTLPAKLWHDIMLTAHEDKVPVPLPGTHGPRRSPRPWPHCLGKAREAPAKRRSCGGCSILLRALEALPLFDAALRRGARGRLHTLAAIAMQARAMFPQPRPRLFMAWHGALDESPEAGPVIHVGEMRDLVRGEIVEHERWREHEPPGEGQRARRRARSPARGLVAHEDALRREIEAPRVVLDARLQVEMGLTLQPVEQPARRVLLGARHIETRQPPHADTRTLGPGRSGFRVFGSLDPHHATAAHLAREAKHMRAAAKGNDGAVGEGHGRREAGDTLFQPIKMTREKFVGVGEARIERHGEHRTASRLIYLQAEPSCACAPPQNHGDVEPADLDLDGLAAREIEPL